MFSSGLTVTPVLSASVAVLLTLVRASSLVVLFPSPTSSDRLIDEYPVPGPGSGGVSDKEEYVGPVSKVSAGGSEDSAC